MGRVAQLLPHRQGKQTPFTGRRCKYSYFTVVDRGRLTGWCLSLHKHRAFPPALMTKDFVFHSETQNANIVTEKDVRSKQSVEVSLYTKGFLRVASYRLTYFDNILSANLMKLIYVNNMYYTTRSEGGQQLTSCGALDG